MEKREARRITRVLSDGEKKRLETYRSQIAEEMPALQGRERLRKEAREEATLSGELRRSVHQSDLGVVDIATRAGITPVQLDEFLTGERTLRSDVMDRLAAVLGYVLNRAG